MVRGFLYERGRHTCEREAGIENCVDKCCRKHRRGKRRERDKDIFSVIEDMGIGINIGNTLDAIKSTSFDKDGETGWGNPKITREYIQTLKSYGYKTVKLPVTWTNHIDLNDPAYPVAPEWLSRVTEVVNWILDEGLYCIINMHHDAGIGLGALERLDFRWGEQNYEDVIDTGFPVFKSVWKQIAAGFKNTGEKLVFEGFNEVGFDPIAVLTKGEAPTENGTAIFNKLNQIFVDVIRSSGGKNRLRYLIVPGIWHNFDVTLKAPLFKMPVDTINGRLFLGLHYFVPSNFAFGIQETWGAEEDYKELGDNFKRINDAFISKGVPVILTEYLCGAHCQEFDARVRWMAAVTKTCLENDICPVHWEGSAEIERLPPYSMGNMLYEMWNALAAKDDQ